MYVPWVSFALAVQIVNVIPFNGENELLDVRVHELGGVVDAFFVVEARYTQYGEPKPIRYAPESLSSSRRVHHIIMDWSPPHRAVGCTLGWTLERRQRDHVFLSDIVAMARSLGVWITARDLVVLTDADEIPSTAAILSIRHAPPRDRIVHPIVLQRFLYHFGWKERRSSQQAAVARVSTWVQWKQHDRVPMWGSSYRGGWHCSKCVRASDLNVHFRNYLCGDGVRWGDFTWPLDVSQALIQWGVWPGNRRRDPRPQAVNAMQEAPVGAWRYPHLVVSHPNMDLSPPPRIAMPYCNSSDVHLKALIHDWCKA